MANSFNIEGSINQPRRAGFTLVELLVVVSIIGVLASVVLASLNSARDKARIASGQVFADNLYHSQGVGAVGMWNLDEGSGNNITDQSSFRNDGTNNGATWSTDVPYGSLANSLSFGSGTFVSVPEKNSLHISQSGFTYMAWIKPTALPNSYNMFMGQYLPYFNVNSAGILHFSMDASGQKSAYGKTKVSLGNWHQVAATYGNDGYMNVYLDGKLDTNATYGPYTGATFRTSNFYIGKWRNDNTYFFTGNISQVRFFNAALSTAQIEKIYAKESARYDLAAI